MKWVPLAAMLVLAGCSSEPGGTPDRSATAAPAGAPPTRSAPTVSCVALEEVILHVHPTRESLRARFGEPDSTRSTTAPNRHVPGATDTLFTVHYPGLVAEVHRPEGGRDLADLVTVEENRYVAIPGVGIGTTEEAVLAAIGAPTRSEDDALVYWCGEGAEQPVRFELADGRVRAIVVDYYVD